MKINIGKNGEEVINTLYRWGDFEGNYNEEATLTTLYNRGLRAWIQNNGNFSVLKYNAIILEFDTDCGKILVHNIKDACYNYNDLLLNIRNSEEARLGIEFWTITNFDDVNISISYQ